MAQHDDAPLPDREREERAHDGVPVVDRGGARPAVAPHRTGCSFGGRELVRPGEHLAPGAAPRVDPQVRQDAACVGERVALRRAGPGAVGALQGVLRELLRAVPVPAQEVRHAVQRVAGLAHERGELLVARAAGDHVDLERRLGRPPVVGPALLVPQLPVPLLEHELVPPGAVPRAHRATLLGGRPPSCRRLTSGTRRTCPRRSLLSDFTPGAAPRWAGCAV
ncbi:Uncharacterised protein [Mycobacteroides abscessus]|nr:Uncharacterised protein [Mycobacteroides abscessus]